MKKIIILSTILFLASCGNNETKSVDELMSSDNVVELKAKRDQLQNQSDSLQSIIGQLNGRITELDPQAPKLVKGVIAEDTTYYHYIKLQANIETDQDVQVMPEYSGVIRLNVRAGQNIGRGQLIGTISDGGLNDELNQAKIQVDQVKAQLQQAEIQRDLAKTTYERRKSLWDKKVGSEMQYLQAKTEFETSEKNVQAVQQQVNAAQRGVSGVQARLAKTRLYAPFSGRVEEVITQSGQAVAPGTPVIRLVNPATVKAVANVPETYLPDIKQGSKAVISLPALEKDFESNVSLVSSAINPGNRTFKVEVPIPDKDGLVKPNLNAELRLNDYTSENAIVLPETVVREDGDGKFVLVVENIKDGVGKAKKVLVEAGPESNGMVEILSGLKDGQIVITEGPAKLKDGDNVKRSK